MAAKGVLIFDGDQAATVIEDGGTGSMVLLSGGTTTEVVLDGEVVDFLVLQGGGPPGPPGIPGIHVTDDWATDPVNPQNGGDLPAGIVIFER